MYEPPLDPEKLAAWGVRPEDFPVKTIEIWEGNWLAYELFCQVRTQWRTSMSGVIGLDYNFLNILMDWREVPRAEREELLSKISVMEYTALEIIHKKKG